MAEDNQQQFDAEFFRSLPERPDLVDIVRAADFLLPPKAEGKQFKHTGKIIIKRLKSAPELAMSICWALRSGMSARAVALAHRISPNSVATIAEALRDRGELEAVSKRVDSILDRFIWLASERIEEGILLGEVHPGQLPIPLMAAIDKRSQRDAGMVLGTGITQGEAALAEIEARWAAAKRLVDLKSEATVAQVVDVHVLDVIPAVVDTSADTGPTAARAAGAGPVVGSTEAGAGARAAEAEAGWGGSDSAGGQEPRLDAPENFGT